MLQISTNYFLAHPERIASRLFIYLEFLKIAIRHAVIIYLRSRPRARHKGAVSGVMS